MTIPEEKKAGYITLKEAGERFGYSQDYLGQLIRKGKLEGKLVYSHVAWVTTPEAVEEYLAGGHKKKKQGIPEQEPGEVAAPLADDDASLAEEKPSSPHVVSPEGPMVHQNGARWFLISFRALLLLIIVLVVYIFYLLMIPLGATLRTNTNVASASVVFSVPSVSGQQAIDSTLPHE